MTTALIISPSPALLPDRVTGIAVYPFSRCFEGMPAFGSPLVLLSFIVNLLAFRNSGFSLLRRVYTFGLDGIPKCVRAMWSENDKTAGKTLPDADRKR